MRSQTWRWMFTLCVLLALGPSAARRWAGGGFSLPPRPFRVAPPAAMIARAEPQFSREFLEPATQTPSVHVASLCELTGGRLLASWYGGTREGATDVAIFTATLEHGTHRWSAPARVVTRDSARQELGRYVKKVGNAVVFADGSDRVSMLFVTIAFGGWSGSTLNLKTSNDGGQTWSPAERLQISPLLNLSELVKNQPVPLRDGGWAVPGYHELLGKFSEILWLAPGTNRLRYAKSRVTSGATSFQPALVPLSAERAVMLGRDYSAARQLWISRTGNAGASWTEISPAGLPNPGSGLDAIRLHDGRILVAFNDSTQGRGTLRLAVSPDGGITWQRAATALEEETGEEFSYPFLLQTRDGIIHLAYTWKRKAIRHAAFNAAWLDAGLAERAVR